ncbi:DUF6371 domain-containing protein [Sediminitomix flava]|uniref:DUF6371 domain-containing protein n=1 Tax=Sediminitomix flava TaxID=379075 RepID=A0A315ZAQ0_SEDFL|nr:DUF6371 domain-containing protein [Sediminitomix flava]PWJ42655.1 hypothetical protein BC781_102200 [Sediminitomix flava]
MNFFKGNRYSIAKKCPCGKSNRDGKFIPYVGETDYGFCHACDTNFIDEYKDTSYERVYDRSVVEAKPVAIRFITYEKFGPICKAKKENNLYTFLETVFGLSKITDAIEEYCLGSSKDGGAVFWQIDVEDNVRKAKVMFYNKNGHRNKSIPPLQPFKNSDGYTSCLFGEHLLKNNLDQDVCIVESEKTAIIGRIVYPNMIWLATGGLSNFSVGKCRVLEGRRVFVIPDFHDNARNAWFRKCEEISKFCDAVFIDPYPEEDSGIDIADILVDDHLMKNPLARQRLENLR